jgi:hypothetical protein
MKKKKSKTKKIKEEVSKAAPPSEDAKFDFGGLAARDLKKNLGCG